ncbi:MAG TPA: molecular chaperone HtpG, partial [Anaerolineae bacterium]|nr:molecular chaperone HtpG [Anaerolineae bacterium]
MTDTTQEAPVEQIEFRAEIQQLLDILIHSLYSNKEIFLRELISNASDALNRLKFEMLTNREVLHPDAELGNWLEADEDAGTLTIRDTGIGMTHDEIVQSLGTIAHSGAKEFVKAMQEAGKQGQGVTTDVIGQFGVGFYSVFMVADEVTVTSRSYKKETEAVAWSSSGQGTYTVVAGEKPERGTIIQIKLKDDAKEFARGYRIRQIVKTHSDFIEFPIYLKEEKLKTGDNEEKKEKEFEWTRINEQTAIWRQSQREVDDEKYKSFYRQLTMDFGEPLLRLHTSADAPVQFYALLFVPSKRDYRLFGTKEDHGLKLYARKVLIKENFKDLLPPYLRFIEGVVDSEDVPLNVSRELVQATPLIEKIKKTLIRRVSSGLEELASEKPDTYKTFWKEFGSFLKEGLAIDPEAKSKFVDLLRFPSSHSANADDLVSFKDYAGRMKPDQKEIYYVIGDDYSAVARSAHLDYFKKHDIEVLYLIDPLDSFMLVSLTEYDNKPLKNVDDSNLELPAEEKIETAAEEKISSDDFETLVARVKEVLGDRIEDVRESKILVDSPVRLVNPPDAMNANMARVQRLLGKDYQVPKKVMELNRGHAMIQNLSDRLEADAGDPLLNPLIEQLYESELLAEGIHPNPADMLPRIQQLMQAAARFEAGPPAKPKAETPVEPPTAETEAKV